MAGADHPALKRGRWQRGRKQAGAGGRQAGASLQMGKERGYWRIIDRAESAMPRFTMWKQCRLAAVLAAALAAVLCASVLLAGPAGAQSIALSTGGYDAALAARLGGNDNGMRNYVLVVLKTGPRKMPEGAGRTAMFEGHFANIQRLAAEQKLVFAGPLDGVDGWRGIFVFATGDIDEAKRLVATDPVIINGEMVAECHKLFGSAGLMMVTELHKQIQKPKKPQ